MQYQLSRIVAGPFLHTIWRPKLTGAEHVPASGGAILAANHLSVVDSVFLPLVLDRPVTYSAEPLVRPLMGVIWLLPVLGWLADDSGVIVPAAVLPFALPLGIAILATAAYPLDQARYGESTPARPTVSRR